MENNNITEDTIPKPIFIFNDNGSIRRVELPKIPLYGRYNPIPREERISKITGEKHFPFNKEKE